MSHLGSLGGGTPGVTFESLLGHFNSFGVSVELGARPLHNPRSAVGHSEVPKALQEHCLGHFGALAPWPLRTPGKVAGIATLGSQRCFCNLPADSAQTMLADSYRGAPPSRPSHVTALAAPRECLIMGLSAGSGQLCSGPHNAHID